MKTLTSLLIGCSLALAGAALAQQPDEQQQPSKGKHAPEKAHAAQAQPGAAQKAHAPQPQGGPNAAAPQEKPAKQPGAMKERGATNEHAATNEPGTNEPGAMKEHGAMKEPGVTNESGAEKGRKAHAGRESANAPETNVSEQPAGAPKAGAKQQAEQQRKQQADQQRTEQAEQQRKGMKGPAAAEAGKAQSAPVGGQQNVQANAGAKAKKPDQQQVQQIKSEHANFKAQPKPQQVPTVTFNQNHRIQGSDRWQGQQYEAFRSYHAEWHDQGWYRSHYSRVELIGGGYYYFNAGYWYPAWGYSPSAQYYAYDGPIYGGQRAEPPDKVIANVQAELQQMGYYKGEVDGLLGPLTREALTAYQADQGLTQTAAIDQPTLDSLEMS